MKNYNITLTNRQQRYHPEKLIKKEYFTGEEILPSDQSRIMQGAKFTIKVFFRKSF